MDTVAADVKKQVGTQIKRARWALGLTGALSVVYGIVILVWPDISLYSLVILFGAFAFARGVVGLGMALGGPIREGRGWLALSSLAGITVGVLTFFWTDMSALALLYVIGAYAITLGIIAVGGAFWLPLDDADRVVLGLTGFVGILFGIVMFAKPGDGALALLALISAYALITGVAELTAAIGGKRILERRLHRAFPSERRPATAQPSR
jgi:uncharacterized membrane protein HdeD (DUF308 family)